MATKKTLSERLTRLKNYRTRYELAVSNFIGQSYLLAYCGSKRRQTVLEVVRKHGLRLTRLTGQEEITFAKRAADGAMLGDWKVSWTGRTQREAICNNELIWIGTLPE